MTILRIEVPVSGVQVFEVDADKWMTPVHSIFEGEIEPIRSDINIDPDTNNWVISDAYPPVSVCDEELESEGYKEIVSQDGKGEVVLRNEDGRLEFFAIRDSYSGWSIQTDDGRVLEFVHFD